MIFGRKNKEILELKQSKSKLISAVERYREQDRELRVMLEIAKRDNGHLRNRVDALRRENHDLRSGIIDHSCSSSDPVYIFKVKDYTTELVGRYNESKGFYYVQRGDGTVYRYFKDRIESAELYLS